VYRGIPPFRHLLQQRAVDIAMIDLDIGMSGFLKVAHAAETFDIPVVNHLATEIMAHGIAAVPNGLTVEFYPWAQELFLDPPRLEGGELVLSQRPGYGLELDEGAMARLALE
jgi:L-alanine-DL-glutamate epimerase-like enolase superfamily enzyme